MVNRWLPAHDPVPARFCVRCGTVNEPILTNTFPVTLPLLVNVTPLKLRVGLPLNELIVPLFVRFPFAAIAKESKSESVDPESMVKLPPTIVPVALTVPDTISKEGSTVRTVDALVPPKVGVPPLGCTLTKPEPEILP